ncbi:unnamed protein product [Boreogadus saida]
MLGIVLLLHITEKKQERLLTQTQDQLYSYRPRTSSTHTDPGPALLIQTQDQLYSYRPRTSSTHTDPGPALLTQTQDQLYSYRHQTRFLLVHQDQLFSWTTKTSSSPGLPRTFCIPGGPSV